MYLSFKSKRLFKAKSIKYEIMISFFIINRHNFHSSIYTDLSLCVLIEGKSNFEQKKLLKKSTFS